MGDPHTDAGASTTDTRVVNVALARRDANTALQSHARSHGRLPKTTMHCLLSVPPQQRHVLARVYVFLALVKADEALIAFLRRQVEVVAMIPSVGDCSSLRPLHMFAFTFACEPASLHYGMS